MQATRKQILDHLRQHGRATIRELGEELGLTSTGIRQHLTILEREEYVEANEERGQVGRPALVYRLSQQGDALYPKTYDQLANILLEEVREVAGGQVLQTLLRRVATRFAEPYHARVQALPLEERVFEAARIISERGCAADVERDKDGWLIKQYSCPMPNVARQNSCVCALDVEFVRQLVGTDARLTTSLLRDDPACTFRVRDDNVTPALTSARPGV
ncbi:MAG: winged helix-turn-helix transcriptional regulator [Dehalococcoidia bacterium]